MPPSAESADRTSSYRQILKSTALVGGVQVVNIFLGVVRTKVLAVLLGPGGMGTVGMFQSATAVVATVTGMGITQSGVRQIAEAAATQDSVRIGRTVTTLRLTAVITGLLGMLVTLALSVPLSCATFGNETQAWSMALLSVTLLFAALTGGHNALLQGLRRLKDLAANQIAGAVLGTVLSIALVYWYRERGIAAFLVAASAASLVTSWWFARKVRVGTRGLTFGAVWAESRGLLVMGAAFMTSGLLSSAAGYGTRVLIGRELGIDAVGLYGAAWTLSNLYVGSVLGAMGADYYPRLTAVSADDASVNRLVNEQTQIASLVALPGLLLTITIAPLVLSLFYSAAFRPAADLIRWQAVGVGLRVVSWPIAFILLAKGKSGTYVLTEAVSWSLLVLLVALCTQVWGLEGAGIAFALTYVGVVFTVLIAGRHASGFSWKPGTYWPLAGYGLLVAIVMIATRFPGRVGLGLGLLLTVGSAYFSLRRIGSLLDLGTVGGLGLVLGLRRQSWRQPEQPQ